MWRLAGGRRSCKTLVFGEGGCTPHPSSDREPVEINNGLSFATDKVGSENLANSLHLLVSCRAAWQFTGAASKSRAAARNWELVQAKRLAQGWECAQGRGSKVQPLCRRLGQGGSKIAFPKSEKASFAHQFLDVARADLQDNQLHSKLSKRRWLYPSLILLLRNGCWRRPRRPCLSLVVCWCGSEAHLL